MLLTLLCDLLSYPREGLRTLIDLLFIVRSVYGNLQEVPGQAACPPAMEAAMRRLPPLLHQVLASLVRLSAAIAVHN